VSTNPYEPSRVAEPYGSGPLRAQELPYVIEYDMTLDDYVEFNMHYLQSFVALRVVLIATELTIVFGFQAVFVAAWLTDPMANAQDAISAVLFVAISTVLIIPVIVWIAWRGPFRLFTAPLLKYLATRGDTSSMFGPSSLTISASEIAERGPKSEHRFALSAVQKIVLARHHFYIYVSTLQAIVVPRRAFADPREAEMLVNLLEHLTHVKAASS